MSQQTSLPVIAGTDAKASDHNAVVNDLGRLYNGEMPMFDHGAAIVIASAVPPTPGLFKFQAGTSVQFTNSAGGGGLTFPTPFPGGVLSVLATEGDNTAPGVLAILNAQVSQSGFGFQYQQTGVNIVRTNWLAIGW